MKKTVLSAIFGIAVAATAAVSFYVSHNGGNAEMDELTLANIEALSQNEDGLDESKWTGMNLGYTYWDTRCNCYRMATKYCCFHPGYSNSCTSVQC